MNRSEKPAIRSGLMAGVVLTLAGVGLTFSAPPAPLPPPDWAAIFNPDGTVSSLQGGLDAIFMEDKISDGVGLDMSISPNPGNHWVVDNGPVDAAHDLGNGYLWVTSSAAGDMILHAGVERLSSTADTFVEFEFNQSIVQVHGGVPWQVHGGRTAGDLQVTVHFTGGVVSSAEFKKWDGAGFWVLIASGPEGCSGSDYRFCVGPPPMQSVQADVWDASNHPVQVRQPDSFLEIGIDVASLLGSNIEFTSIQVRTPQDVILDSLRRLGEWARRAQGGGL